MTWLAPKLRERIQILKPRLDPNEDGGFDSIFGENYGSGFGGDDFAFNVPMLTVWAEPKAVSPGQYIRGEQVAEGITEQFKVRRIAVAGLGTEFTSSFSTGFDSIEDLMPLKSQYYILMERGSSVKGRLFKVKDIVDRDERREYLRIDCEEIEERGTGHPA